MVLKNSRYRSRDETVVRLDDILLKICDVNGFIIKFLIMTLLGIF